jgi:hypothetical protein
VDSRCAASEVDAAPGQCRLSCMGPGASRIGLRRSRVGSKMLALGVISASLALLGLSGIVPAYLDTARPAPWLAGFAVAELSAVGTGAVAAAEHFSSTGGALGTAGAGAAGLVLLRAAQTGRAYKRKTYFDEFTPLPDVPPAPEWLGGGDGCRAVLISGVDYQDWGTAGRLQYLVHAELHELGRVVVRGRLEGPTWAGLGIRKHVLLILTEVFATCDQEDGNCVAVLRNNLSPAESRAPLHYAVEFVQDLKGGRVACTVNLQMSFRARSAPNLGVGGVVPVSGQLPPTDNSKKLPMGRFLWECRPATVQQLEPQIRRMPPKHEA